MNSALPDCTYLDDHEKPLHTCYVTLKEPIQNVSLEVRTKERKKEEGGGGESDEVLNVCVFLYKYDHHLYGVRC
jgi:hypothetical protein